MDRRSHDIRLTAHEIQEQRRQGRISRREFLRLSISAPAAYVLAACAGSTATQPSQLATAIPPAALAGASQPQNKPVTIDMWFHVGAGGQREGFNQLFGKFQATHPDIRINQIGLPEADYNKQVQAAAQGAAIGGDLPSLLEFDGPNTYNYVWNGFLRPLDGYISEEMKADFLPSIIAQGTYQDGKLYSLGQFDSGLAIWGNKKYLEQAQVRLPTVDQPWTRDEFEAALGKLQALPGVEHALDMKMNYGIGEWYSYGFSPILQSFGADLIDRTEYQSTDGVLNGPEAVAALTMVQNWFKQGYVNSTPATDTEFVDGKTALSWVGHWVAPSYGEALGDNLLLLPMPNFGHGPKTGMGIWNFGITSTCKHPEAAWEVLKFLMEPEQILLWKGFTGIPARRSALKLSPAYAPGKQQNLYIQQFESGFAVPRPITPAYPTISQAFAQAFQNIAGGAGVKAELDKAAQTIDKDIKNHNGYRPK
jgi:multiple sugar transport system substrate-binding protein